jgi:acyl-CoA thioesterase I
MEAIMSELAREEKVGLFSRFTPVRKSIEAGVSPSALVSWDGLQNTADGCDCIGCAGRFKFGPIRSAASHRPTPKN